MASESADSGSPPLNETAAPTVYPGQSAPFTVVTATDQTGIVIISTVLALIFSILSMLIRLFIRMQFRHEFARDDVAAVGAMALFVVQSGLVFGQVSFGFGKTIDDISDTGLVQLQKIGYTSDIFALMTLWATKCSIAYLFIRLSPDRVHILLAKTCLGVCTFFMVLSIFVTLLRCDLHSPWIFIGQQCVGLLSRWQAVVAFDVFTEAALFGVAVYMTVGLQLDFSKKTVVLLAFALRLPVIVPAILRISYLDTEISSSDPTLEGVMATVSMQIQISYAIIAMTTPCLRPFMSALNTHYGGPKEPRTSPSSTKASKTAKSTGYSLSSLSRSKADRPTTAPTTPKDDEEADHHRAPVTRWDGADYRVAVVSRNLSIDGGSTQSNDSQRMIISKNTEWQVDFGTDSTQPVRPPQSGGSDEIGVAKS
ncbi:hypothetical protein B0H66DRAFT_555879 [Apodospora peruviana]|uniref:Rhodopsin domain-containing protein n=1 Tax=Apodospora peruviana TaxID=516989 RepID=A0AAE0I461_9PEZI|nr:hypothetical protein B0H66DRAFT_555879 [Apodospora peruviana]